ncbi:MAG: N-acetyltransferase [Bacteroidota bacterium]
MSHNIVIRSAQPSDLDAVWRLWKAIMDQKVYYPYDDSYNREDIEGLWINIEQTIRIAELEGKIVGAYILHPNQPGYGKHIVNAAYMVDIGIRGKGIGSLLCADSIEIAKQEGYRGMQFNLVVSTNTGAIKVWEAHGFKIIGTVPGGFYHVEKGYVDAYIFFKSLI